MRVLVARPAASAEATAAKLARRGHSAIVAPVLEIVPSDTPPPEARPDALVVTSRHAVPALLAQRDRFTGVEAFAVGEETARALREAGFAAVASRRGTARSLAADIAAALPPGARLLHAAGLDRKAEPERSLQRAGFVVDVWEAYEARALQVLPEAARQALGDGDVEAVLHYSPRSARILVELALAAGLEEALARPVHLCLSREVAGALAALGGVRIEVASQPEEGRLLDRLDALAGPQDGPIDARAREAGESDARHGTNQSLRLSQPAKDDRHPMSDTRRQDPLRRTPPTIDLKADVVPSKTGDPAADSPVEEGASAVEPVASTGLGADPFPKGGDGPKTVPAGDTKSAAAKPTDPKAAVETPAAKAAVTSPKPTDQKAAETSAKDAKAGTESPAGPAPVAKAAVGAAPVSTPSSPRTGPTPAGSAPSGPGKPGEPAAKPPSAVAGAPSGPAAKIDAGTGAAKPSEPKAGEPAKAPEPTRGSVPSSGGSAASPEAKRPAATAEPARAPGGGGAVLTAGFVGGLLGAVIAVCIGYYFLPNQALDERIGGLERRLAALPTGPGPLEPRVGALESGLRQATEEARAAKSAAEAAGRQAADAAGRPVGTAGPDQEARSGIQALTGRVGEATAKTDANAAALGELGQRLDAFGKTTTERLTAIARDIETFTTHQRSLQADVAALRTGSAALDTRAAEADKRLASLTEAMGRVSTDLAKLSPAAIQAGLRVVVSGRLDDALRHGAPLGPAVSALAKLGTEAPALAPLRPFTDTPAPSPAALLAEFKPLGAAMTTEPAKPDETWMDRGRRVLGKVVTVQPIGDGSGQDVPGLVQRIETSLGRGAIADARIAWDALPEGKRRPAAAWGEKLTARAAAEDATRRIGAQALSTLDATTR